MNTKRCEMNNNTNIMSELKKNTQISGSSNAVSVSNIQPTAAAYMLQFRQSGVNGRLHHKLAHLLEARILRGTQQFEDHILAGRQKASNLAHPLEGQSPIVGVARQRTVRHHMHVQVEIAQIHCCLFDANMRLKQEIKG